MALYQIVDRKCLGCGECLPRCPFQAIAIQDGIASVNAGCRACGACVEACPEKAIIRLETMRDDIDKTQWKGLLVVAETLGGRLHPVSLELLGKALALRQGAEPVNAAVIGQDVGDCAETLRAYGAETVYVYDDPAFSFFRADAFCACAEDCVRAMKPSVALIGATALGRSLAPRLATRFATGLTADCTSLQVRQDGSLIQIRPAFGGNIMAQIVTPFTRPQFATVRYKVMDAPARMEAPRGVILNRRIPPKALRSPILHGHTQPIPQAASICDAQVLVAAGRGLQKKSDLDMIRELAALLGGQHAVSRPLVEMGWESNLKQIGLSGRTVKPRLLIACGISGAIQFTASMDSSERIIAINRDPDAPIFKTAHIGLVGDLYAILPELINLIRKGSRQ